MGALRLEFNSKQNQHAWEETAPLSSRPAPRHQLQPHQNNNVIFSRQGKELELWRIISCWPCCRSFDIFYLPLIFLSSFVVVFFFYDPLYVFLWVNLFTKLISSWLRNETIRIWITRLPKARERKKNGENLTRLLRKRSKVWNGMNKGSIKDEIVHRYHCTTPYMYNFSALLWISISKASHSHRYMRDHVMRVYSNLWGVQLMFQSDRQWSGPCHLVKLGSVWIDSVCRELQSAAKTREIQCVNRVDKMLKGGACNTSLLLRLRERVDSSNVLTALN